MPETLRWRKQGARKLEKIWKFLIKMYRKLYDDVNWARGNLGKFGNCQMKIWRNWRKVQKFAENLWLGNSTEINMFWHLSLLMKKVSRSGGEITGTNKWMDGVEMDCARSRFL